MPESIKVLQLSIKQFRIHVPQRSLTFIADLSLLEGRPHSVDRHAGEDEALFESLQGVWGMLLAGCR